MLTAACAATPAAPVLELHGRVDAPGAAPIDVQLLLQPEHRGDGDRYLRAAMATLTAGGHVTYFMPYDPFRYEERDSGVARIFVNRKPGVIEAAVLDGLGAGTSGVRA
jgi:hypothetical protein